MPSDAETPEAIPTPSRSSRKRARQSEAVVAPVRATRRKTKDTRAAEREDTEGTEAQDHTDAETEVALPTEQEIIDHLKVADRLVHATEDYANDLLEGQEHVPGYGKIAGRDWAFIIRKVEVNIGRPEAHERLHHDNNSANARDVTPSAKTQIDIDLGPDRQVSRLHACIEYDSERAEWFIIVSGRNGLRLDTNPLKRGTKTYLRNGSVIDICGTQMAFITTPTEHSEGPVFDDAIMRQAQKSSEEDDDGDDNTRSHLPSHGHPPARANGSARSQAQEPSAFQSDIGPQQQQHHRTHPHSMSSQMPGTPMRSTQATMPKSSPIANYARGVMMESTESIDYSLDSAKDLKPPHSYAQLIGMAILSTQEQQMTLNNIYKWIMNNYAFYRFNTGGWQNSIRHNLSLNKAFVKIARRTDEPGKGMKWMIAPEEFDSFVSQGMKGCRRPVGAVTQSMAGSPSSPMHANGTQKRDEDVTPPLHGYHPAYPTAMEAYTPDRGPRRQDQSSVGLGINGDAPELEYLTRSTPRTGMNAAANMAGSPPALYLNDEGRVGPLDTPYPLRPTQRFVPPSTLRRPSDYIQFSSPAPFWKMEGLAGSTPFKPYDISPLKTPFTTFKQVAAEAKTEAGDEEDEKAKMEEQKAEEEEEEEKGSPTIESSSPPRPHSPDHALDPGSPTLSRPVTAAGKTLSQMSAAEVPVQPQTAEQPPTAVNGADHATPVSIPAQPAAAPQPQTAATEPARPMTNGYAHVNGSAANGRVNNFVEPDDDEGIDLVK